MPRATSCWATATTPNESRDFPGLESPRFIHASLGDRCRTGRGQDRDPMGNSPSPDMAERARCRIGTRVSARSGDQRDRRRPVRHRPDRPRPLRRGSGVLRSPDCGEAHRRDRAKPEVLREPSPKKRAALNTGVRHRSGHSPRRDGRCCCGSAAGLRRKHRRRPSMQSMPSGMDLI